MKQMQLKRGNNIPTSALTESELYLNLKSDKFIYVDKTKNKFYYISRKMSYNTLTELNDSIGKLNISIGDLAVVSDIIYVYNGQVWNPVAYDVEKITNQFENNSITDNNIESGSISLDKFDNNLQTIFNQTFDEKYGINLDGTNEYLTRPIQIISKTDWRSLSTFNSVSNVTGSNSNITNDLSRPYVVPLSSSLFNSNGYIGVTGSAGLIIGKRYMGRITYYNDNATDFRIGPTNSSSAYKLLDKKSKNWQESEFNFIATSTDFYVKLNGTGTGYVQELRIKEDTGLDLNDSEMIWDRQSRKFNQTNTELITNGTFDTDLSGWLGYDTGVITWNSGKASYNGGASSFRQTKLTIGKRYLISFDWVRTSGALVPYLGNGTYVGIINSGASGTFSATGICLGNQNIDLYSSNFLGTIDNVSYIEIPTQTSNGNHTFSVSTDSPFTAGGVTGKTQSGKIVASGAGDSTTNFIGLPSTSFNVSGSTDSRTKILSGYKYLITFLAKPVTNNTTINVNIGSKTGTALTLADNTKWYLYTYQFLATSSEVDTQLKIFLGNADTVYIDELSITKAYDMLINIWDRNIYNNYTNILNYGTGGSLNYNGIAIWRELNTNILYFVLQCVEYTSVQNNSTFSYNVQINNNLAKIKTTLFTYENIKEYENNSYLGAVIKKIPYLNNNSNNIFLGAYNGISSKYLGLIGQIQFVRFNNADSFNPLDIDGAGTSIYEYSQTHKGYPATYTGGEIVFWFDWNGKDIDWLKDLSGRNNDLTGFNIDYIENRKRYILE